MTVTGRPAIRILIHTLRLLVLAGGGLLIGIAAFDFVLMPQLTGRGQEVQVPDLIGRSVANASQVLEEEGLVLGEVGEEFSSIYPDGYVVTQSPEPLTKVKRGQAVNVRASFGREGLVVPDVRGDPYRQAQVSLSRSGFRMGSISHAYSTQVAKGAVMATAPESGAMAGPGDDVDLLISLGAPPVSFVVPNLRGRTIEEVRAFFDRTGIRLVEVPAEGNVDAPPGTIVGQRPLTGRRIRPSDVIEVDVAAEGRGRWR